MPKTDQHTHRKRHGKHQKRSPHFLKVYRPFLPVVAALIVGAASFITFNNKPSAAPVSQPSSDIPAVLAYATNVNSSGLLSATNQRRAAAGAASLTVNAKLNAAAQAKANDMATRNYWSHNTPEGNPPWVFFSNAGYSYEKAGENLACGFDDSTGVITGWFNSASHKANLLNTSYQEVGFGIANSENYNCGNISTTQQTIVVAMYGTPYNSTPTTTTQTTQSKTKSSAGGNTKPAAASSAAPASTAAEVQPINHIVVLAVTDADGKPAKGVKVTIHSDPQTAYSNEKGEVTFTGVPSGKHTVTVEIEGAKTETPIELTAANPEIKLTIQKPTLPGNSTGFGASDTQSTEPISFTRLDTFTNGYTPWALAALVILSITGVVYLIGKHSRKVHRLIVKGERYVLTHKLVDAAIIVLLVGLYFLTRSVAAVL